MPYIGKTPSQGVRERYYYTASGSETSLSGADDNGLVLDYADAKYVDVYLNGLLLVHGTDYNTNTTDTIAGLAALAANDIVEILVYDVFSIFGGDVTGSISVQKDNLKIAGVAVTTTAAELNKLDGVTRNFSTDGTKLDGIEASATADQTAAEIRALVESATDSNVFTDADHTKLNGIAASSNNYVHPNHSGEVTSTADGATVVANNIIDEARLKVSNAPTNGYALTAQSGNTGGLTWAAVTTDISGKANIASPALTGTPTAPTASASTNTTQLATTAYVTTAVGNAGGGATTLITSGTLSSGASTITMTGFSSSHDTYILTYNFFVESWGQIQIHATQDNGTIYTDSLYYNKTPQGGSGNPSTNDQDRWKSGQGLSTQVRTGVNTDYYGSYGAGWMMIQNPKNNLANMWMLNFTAGRPDLQTYIEEYTFKDIDKDIGGLRFETHNGVNFATGSSYSLVGFNKS